MDLYDFFFFSWLDLVMYFRRETLEDGEGQRKLECCSPVGLQRVGHN